MSEQTKGHVILGLLGMFFVVSGLYLALNPDPRMHWEYGVDAWVGYIGPAVAVIGVAVLGLVVWDKVTS